MTLDEVDLLNLALDSWEDAAHTSSKG